MAFLAAQKAITVGQEPIRVTVFRIEVEVEIKASQPASCFAPGLRQFK